AELPWSHEQSSMDYLGYADNQYNLDQLAELQGNFPLTELLQFWGMDESEYYIVYEPSFVRYLGKIYNEKNLEAMKAYFIVHTALEALMYLDVESAEDAAVLMQADNEDETMGEEEEPGEEIEINSQLSEEEEQILEIASTYLFPNLIDAIQQVYIGRHFSSQMREEVLALVEDIKEYYIELLKNTEWLGPETREEGIRKLNNMYVHVFYPDVLTDYSGLDYLNYEEGGNLLDAIYDIRTFNFTPESEKINQAVDRGEWDLSSVNTLASNAYYMLMNNSVYILAGIAAGGITYGLDSPLEQNYARLGMIIGHEITHAFDNSGYNFDADGLENKWWTSEDEVAFRMKADRLANHYGTLSFLPGVEGGYDGTIVQGEAIADMGGMKCMLALAEDIPDFDYEKFFISYANLFCYKTDLGSEMQLAMDVHPLGFLRTNVTVQQFDEFFETFDIGPGDGMYLAPEDRIMVW
ncbi:MAG: M13 family metallopeptidase, partial [Bacillota bacterium]|nr:M13 family metallopeptidase [Bacillota bacterium]